MNSPDFSVEEEVNKVLDILEKACKRFGVDRPVSPRIKRIRARLKPNKRGGGNGVRGQNV